MWNKFHTSKTYSQIFELATTRNLAKSPKSNTFDGFYMYLNIIRSDFFIEGVDSLLIVYTSCIAAKTS